MPNNPFCSDLPVNILGTGALPKQPPLHPTSYSYEYITCVGKIQICQLDQDSWLAVRSLHFLSPILFQVPLKSLFDCPAGWDPRKISALKKEQDIKHLTTKSKAESQKHMKLPTKTNVSGTNSHLSLISLNINGLSSPIKRHKLTDWTHKQDPTFFCIQETHFNNKDRHYLRVRGWKKFFQANGPRKQAGVAILISNKMDFQWKVTKRDEEGHFILIKGKIQQEKVSILNIYA